mmetsp:Transcript_21623/g.34609  ORF Transcript_21623/g.34609 Transcript_21623/m.34609 type:complete len:83 (-) Transcript_21623:49-297(-)
MAASEARDSEAAKDSEEGAMMAASEAALEARGSEEARDSVAVRASAANSSKATAPLVTAASFPTDEMGFSLRCSSLLRNRRI